MSVRLRLLPLPARVFQGLLFGVSMADPRGFAIALSVMFLVAVVFLSRFRGFARVELGLVATLHDEQRAPGVGGTQRGLDGRNSVAWAVNWHGP